MSQKEYELKLPLTAREIAALWATVEYARAHGITGGDRDFQSLHEKITIWLTANAKSIKQMEQV